MESDSVELRQLTLSQFAADRRTYVSNWGK